MRRVLLLLALSTVCLATCPSTIPALLQNTEWATNHIVIKMFNWFYDSIALTSADLCSIEKHFVSLFTLIKTIFLTTDNPDPAKAVAIARGKTMKQLKNTASAMAGTFRGAIVRILNVIDQPINDILTSCKPDTPHAECQAALRNMRNENAKKCKGYEKNVDFYNKVSQWANDQDSINYIDEMNNMSKKKNNDTAILDFLKL